MSSSSTHDYGTCKVCGAKMKPSFTEVFCPREDKHTLPLVVDDWNIETWPGIPSTGDLCPGCGACTLEPFSTAGFGISLHCPSCGRCY